MLFFVLLWEIQERERLCGKDTGKRTSLWQGYRLRNVCGGFTEIDKRKEGKKRMIRNRKYLGRRCLQYYLRHLLCAAAYCRQRQKSWCLWMWQKRAECSSMQQRTTHQVGQTMQSWMRTYRRTGIADTEETESGWEEADGLILQMEEVEDPELVEEAPMGSRFPYDHEGRGAPDEH